MAMRPNYYAVVTATSFGVSVLVILHLHGIRRNVLGPLGQAQNATVGIPAVWVCTAGPRDHRVEASCKVVG